MRNNIQGRKMVYSALFLALCLVLPFLTGQIPTIGAMLSPMHIPVLICGFVCGAPWGIVVAVVGPLLRSVLFGMPALFPVAICMAFELAAYGCLAGFLYPILKRISRSPWHIYFSLVIAMLGGRIVWGLAEYIVLGLAGSVFTFDDFLLGAFINALPGIIFHIILIPPVVLTLEKAKMIENGKKNINVH